jgi:hypothetical protein
VFDLGLVLTVRALWKELGTGPAIRACAARANLAAPHEAAFFGMAASRLERPASNPPDPTP